MYLMIQRNSLTTEEVNLLKKGLTFTPTLCYSAFEWVKDVHLFARRLALHKFHKIQNLDTRTLLRRDAEMTDMLEDLERKKRIRSTTDQRTIYHT